MSEAKCETGWGELAPFSLSLGGQTEARSGAAKGAKLGSDRQALPMRPRSRDAFSPGVFQKFVAPKKQGRREGRALAAPVARQQQEKLAAVTTGLAEHTRPSLRDGFAAYTRSPWGPALLPPSPKQFVIAGLASAPGCQDHAISPSHRDCSSARETRAATRHAHRIPHPTSVTTAKRPSCEAGRLASKHNF